ncbi:MAG: hypothetical protein U9R75_06280 [Candidatus Thermoplasmatota archaeon]|nr:hypothetical protein [Candidatus Thermoplasmatota archaeon]
MNTIENRKNGMLAIFLAFILLGAAFLGMAFIPGTDAVPGDAHEPFPDPAIAADLETDLAYVYTHNDDQDIALTWSWADSLPTDHFLSDIIVGITDNDAFEESIYKWNQTNSSGFPAVTATFNYNGSLAADSYDFFLIVMTFNGTNGTFSAWFDFESLEVLDPAPGINSISAAPATVDNGGEDTTIVTIDIERLMDDVDDHLTDVQFWHETGMAWSDLEFPEPEEANITETDYNTVATVEVAIPEDFPVGEYKMLFNLTDLWGYNEVYNETIFTVEWSERAPAISNDTIELDEDFGYAVIDLDDHFEDVNEDDLQYWFNATQFEESNISISWDNESITDMVNISAPENWHGKEHFMVYVMDMDSSIEPSVAKHNVSLSLVIFVSSVEDDLAMVEDTTLLVDENLKTLTFDPTVLFFDPDGPVNNLTVSIGYEEVIVNETTNETEKQPIYTFEDGNISVEINSTVQSMSTASFLNDVENGRWDFTVAAWINDKWVMNGTAYIEVLPVNDVPALNIEKISFYYDETYTGNMVDLFDDPDDVDLTFAVNVTADNLIIEYNETTMNFTISVANNWTGTSGFEVNATDGEDFVVVTIPVEVMEYSYTLTGVVSFEENATHNLTGFPMTLSIGGNAVEINQTTGAYEITLPEGEYEVIVALTTDKLYDEASEKSGYLVPVFENVTFNATKTLDILVMWKDYEPVIVTEQATWADIDFTNAVGPSDGDDNSITFSIPVDETKTGYGDIVVALIIYDDENEWEFNFTWIQGEMNYTLELTEEQLDDLSEGKLNYKFSDKDDNETTGIEYTFNKEKEDASLVTVIVLIVLIILVLIALVFIMRKPSEEFDEEEEEEEEEGERTCPSCSETVSDEEAEECPYCGESMKEE